MDFFWGFWGYNGDFLKAWSFTYSRVRMVMYNYSIRKIKCKIQSVKPVLRGHLCTVKPVLRGHLWDKEKVAF